MQACTLFRGGMVVIQLEGLGEQGYDWVCSSEDPLVASVNRIGIQPAPLDDYSDSGEVEKFRIQGHSQGCAEISFHLIRRWAQVPDRTETIVITVQ